MADVKKAGAAPIAPPNVAKAAVSRPPLVKLGADVPAEEKYVVRPNDTLGKIAKQHGVSLDELLKANPAFTTKPRNANLIFPNEQVRIPPKTGWKAPEVVESKPPATLSETTDAVKQTNNNSVNGAIEQLDAALRGKPHSELTGPQLATLEADLKRAADGDPPPEGLDHAQELLAVAKQRMQASDAAPADKEPPMLSRLVMERHLGTALFDTLRRVQQEWAAIGESNPLVALNIARAKGPSEPAQTPEPVQEQPTATPGEVSDLQRSQLLGPTVLEEQDELSDKQDAAARKLEILNNEDGKTPSEVAQKLQDDADGVRVEEPEVAASSQENDTQTPLDLLDQAVVLGHVATSQLIALTDPAFSKSLSTDPAIREAQLKQLRDASEQEATALLRDPKRQTEANELRAATLERIKALEAQPAVAAPEEASATDDVPKPRLAEPSPELNPMVTGAPPMKLAPGAMSNRRAMPAVQPVQQPAPVLQNAAPQSLAQLVTQPVGSGSNFPSAEQQLFEQQLAAMASQRSMAPGYVNTGGYTVPGYQVPMYSAPMYTAPGYRPAGMPYNPYGPNGLAGVAAQTYNQQLWAMNQMAMNSGMQVPNMMGAGGGARQRLMAVLSGGFLVGRHPTEQVKALTQFFVNWSPAKQAELMEDPAIYDQVTSTIAYLLDAPQARGVLGSIINRPLVRTLHTYFPELLTPEKMKRL